MKKIILTVLFFASVNLFAQKAGWDEEKAKQNITTQSALMAKAFIEADYKTFAAFTYPVILKAMGGTSKLTQTLTKTVDEMKEQGLSFNNISFDPPSKIVKSGKELQATIAQHTEVKMRRGRVVTTSTIIAFSTDNGNIWTFVDTSSNDMYMLRKLIPGISKNIIVPSPSKPVRLND